MTLNRQIERSDFQSHSGCYRKTTHEAEQWGGDEHSGDNGLIPSTTWYEQSVGDACRG